MKNVQKFHRFLGMIFLLSISGCSTLDPLISSDKKVRDHHLYERSGIDIIVENASLKATVIKDKDSFERICRSPNPDFASGQTSGVSVGLGQGPTIGTSSGAMIDSLGGRSPAVLITRELMYRACELALNLQANPDLSKEIYWRFLATIELAIKSQTSAGAQSNSVTSNATVPLMMAPSNADALGMPGGGNTLPSGDMKGPSRGNSSSLGMPIPPDLLPPLGLPAPSVIPGVNPMSVPR
jgi:hypothetical protein